MTTFRHFSRCILLLCVSHAAQLSFTVDVYPSPNTSITSGHRRLSAVITVPDMFVKSNTNQRRRLKETPVTTSNKPPTPAPTNKIILPIMLLVPPEGGQDRSVTIYGTNFNLSSSYQAGLFDQLRDQLVHDGKMAVIQYDKRNCKSWTAIDEETYDAGSASMANYTGPEPMCMEQCPDWCPRMLNECGLLSECYNDTNLTVADLVHDAMQVWTEGLAQLRQHLDGDMVELRDLWTVPVGYSAQGASIAAYLASSSSSQQPQLWPTAISLFGASVNIDRLLANQLRRKLDAANTNTSAADIAVANLEHTFALIRNGTLASDQLIAIENYFFGNAELKYAQYWKDWVGLNEHNISYAKLANFLAINSFDDTVIASESFDSFYDLLTANTTAQTLLLRDVNHFMINRDDWPLGRWRIDDAIGERIIAFVNDISGGYLEVIQEWLQWNASRNASSGSQTQSPAAAATPHVVDVDNVTVYQVLLYTAIMAIICILACGVYFIMACKVCPYELDDADENAEAQRQSERDRERRRHRRRRRRRHRHSEAHSHAPQRHNGLLANDALVSQLISNPYAHNELLSDRLLDHHQPVINSHNNDLVAEHNEDQNGNINYDLFVD